MSNEKLDNFLDDFALLIEAGFIAVKQLDEMSANRIFCAAQVLNPMSTAPQIGLGYIALNKLEVKEATRIFTDVTKKEPDNHLAVIFLGMCYLLTKPKRSKGEEIIKEAMEKTDDPTVKNLGAISLDWADKDLKKLKSPFLGNMEEEKKEETENKKTEKK